MSMTIYGGTTKNGVDVDDMVDNKNDLVYYHNENRDFFVRLSQCNINDIATPCVVIFHTSKPFVSIYAKVLDCNFEKYEDEVFVSNKIEECWKESFEFGIDLNDEKTWFLTQEDIFDICKEELIQYAKENGVDLCIETDPLSFELLVEKYMECKEVYTGYSKEEIIKDAIEEWNIEQEADLV